MTGLLLLLVSVVVIIIYGYLIFFSTSEISLIVLKATAFIAVLLLFGILGWIGYTIATTPPPKSIEELEKEIESELKKLDEEENNK